MSAEVVGLTQNYFFVMLHMKGQLCISKPACSLLLQHDPLTLVLALVATKTLGNGHRNVVAFTKSIKDNSHYSSHQRFTFEPVL